MFKAKIKSNTPLADIELYSETVDPHLSTVRQEDVLLVYWRNTVIMEINNGIAEVFHTYPIVDNVLELLDSDTDTKGKRETNHFIFEA